MVSTQPESTSETATAAVQAANPFKNPAKRIIAPYYRYVRLFFTTSGPVHRFGSTARRVRPAEFATRSSLSDTLLRHTTR